MSKHSLMWTVGLGALLLCLTPVFPHTDVPIATGAGPQLSPAIAFDGRDYLVVWEDLRHGAYSDVYGARVNRAGILIDTVSIPISTAPNNQRSVAVASDGKACLVAWEDARGRDLDIYAALVGQDGKLIGQEFPIARDRGDQTSPTVAFDGKNYVIAWADHRAEDWHIFAGRVTPDGTLLDPNGIRVSREPNEEGGQAIAFDGKDYLVVWTAWNRDKGDFDINAVRLTPAGTLLDTSRYGTLISITGIQERLSSLASDRKNWLATWTDWRNGNFDIYGSRIGANGVVLDTAGMAISVADFDQRGSHIVFGKSNYLVVWEDLRTSRFWQVYATQVTPTGQVVFPAGIPVAVGEYTQTAPAAASDGENYYIVWEDWRTGSGDIYGSWMSAKGELK